MQNAHTYTHVVPSSYKNNLDAYLYKLQRPYGKIFFDSKTELIIFASTTAKTATEISSECDIPLSTVYRKLHNLLKRNIVSVSGSIVEGRRHRLFTSNANARDFKNAQRVFTIMRIIVQNPGISFRDLVRISSLTNGIISHYLSQLQKKGFLRIKRQGRRLWLFANDMPSEEMEFISQLRNETARKIVSFLLEEGPAPFCTLAEKIDKSPASISVHLSRLNRKGFVSKMNGIHPPYLLKDPGFAARTISKIRPEVRAA